MRLLLATRNKKKLVELRRVLAEAASDVELVGLDDVDEYPESPETGLTFEDNALLKAREAVQFTRLPSIADDSGLAVDALNGMPGVFSARWSGLPSGTPNRDEANLNLVLAQVADVPDEHLGAAFVCAAALVWPDGRELVVRGEMRGHLIRAPRGDGGFGYDPIFVADGHDRTTAELTPAEKDAISHRGIAFRALAEHL
ncbi:RdgB/HAM1 family non-canonical purine NTP pyrophosphatase [Dactylosporangium sucinum]|uniref:dITP/XTP pyrophosphatase n=1 Tax=Dactylosporangium sucinum TaxID=1424081 RepID=A0A917X5V3_9ACTN|nr:RdgB/HAM1 family non-canonical purine NTP pyrophosphatase [Dactylosporangium sucinum]GGM72580.1 non-canonical purine NTP pyrophosphatase [Dactylosporangium sucinum]